MKKSFRVTLNVPEGATVTDIKNHIRDAVSTVGGLHPDDPLFGLDRESVKVVSIENPWPKTRAICQWCGQDNTGKNKHTHEFCDQCGRIKEHCECAMLAGLVAEGTVVK